MSDDLYLPENALIDRVKARVKGSYGLREVYSEGSLAGVTNGRVADPAVAVVAQPLRIIDSSVECGLLTVETRWSLVAIARAYNDQGRSDRARDLVGRLAVDLIRHVTGWVPAQGFSPMVLRGVDRRVFAGNKVYAPLTFGSTTTINLADEEN